jgi:hypothetical protein
MEASQEKLRIPINTSQETMEAAINASWSKFKETISKWVEDILVPVNQRIQNLRKVFGSKGSRL